MKRLVLACLLGSVCVGANAAYSFPDNAVTSEKNRIVSLESLSYTIDINSIKTVDDLKLCLAEVVDNNGEEFIKAETESAIIVMGNIRVDKNSWGNDELIKYELKASNDPNTIKLKYYNLGFGYIKPNKNPEDIKMRKPADHFGAGGKQTVDNISTLNQSIKNCVDF